MANDFNSLSADINKYSRNVDDASQATEGLSNAVAEAGKSFVSSLNPLNAITGSLQSLVGFASVASIWSEVGKGVDVFKDIEQSALGVTRAMGSMKDYAMWQGEIVSGAQQLGIEYNDYAEAIKAANKHHAALSMSQKDFISFAKNASQFGEAVGASAQQGADAFGKMVGEAKVGGNVIKNVQHEMLALQNAVGLTGEELIELINTGITPVIKQMKLLGQADQDINKAVGAISKLTTSFVAAGFEAGKASQMVEKLLNPENLQSNVMLFNQLGINIDDAISAMTGGGGTDSMINQLNEQLPELANRVKSMGMAGVQYAKTLGIDYKELLQYQNMSSASAKEAAAKASEERKKQDTFNKQFEQTQGTWKKWLVGFTQAGQQLSVMFLEAFDAANFKDLKMLPIEVGRMFATFLKGINLTEIMSTGISMVKTFLSVVFQIVKVITPLISALFSSKNLGAINEAFQSIGRSISRIVERFKPIFDQLAPRIARLGEGIATAITRIMPKIELIINKLNPVIDFIVANLTQVFEQWVDPLLEKLNDFAKQSPGQLLTMIGIGAGGGFIAGIGEDLMTGMLAGVTESKVAGAVKNAAGGFMKGIISSLPIVASIAGVFGMGAAKNAYDKRDTSTEYGTLGRAGDLVKARGKEIGLTGDNSELLKTLENQADAVKKLNAGLLDGNTAKAISIDLESKKNDMEKIRIGLLKGGEFEGYINNLNAEAKIKEMAGENAHVYDTEAINDTDKWASKVNATSAEMAKSFNDYVKSHELQRLAEQFPDAAKMTFDKMLTSTDDKIKTAATDFKNNKMDKMVKRVIEPFEMMGEKTMDMLNKKMISPEQAKLLLQKQGATLDNMNQGLILNLDTNMKKITNGFRFLGINLGGAFDGLWDALKEGSGHLLKGLGWMADKITSLLTEGTTDTSVVESKKLTRSILSNVTGDVLREGKYQNESELVAALQATAVKEAGTSGKQINQTEFDKITQQFIKENSYQIKQQIAAKNQIDANNKRLDSINATLQQANVQRDGGNSALEQIADQIKPKRPVRMINLNELAARAGESGATMLTFGGGS